jgi:hypothetical protein
MSNIISGPTQIVTDGLVLHLDAANKKSYPGTGTVWKDLSGNRNNGTLINGPTFTSEAGGSFIFGGNGNLRRCALPITSGLDANNITLNVVAKAPPQNNGSLLFIFNNSEYLVIGNFTGGVEGPPRGEAFSMVKFNPSNQFSTVRGGEWRFTDNLYHDFTFTRVNNFDTFYVDGIQVGRFSSAQAIASQLYPIALGQRSTSAFFGTITSSIYRIYNRALTPQEILQNYNATKQRFGL